MISVPALFELHQTAATSDAARLAGFERIELIQEPVASAIAAGWTHEGADGPWLVYDLGGGTFDVSLLDTREGLLRVVGHDGDNFLGGRDFDRALTDVVLTKLAADGVVIDPANPAHAVALSRLRFSVEEAKIELTRTMDAPLFIAGLEVDGQHVDIDLMLTRAELDALAEPLIDRSIAICSPHSRAPSASRSRITVCCSTSSAAHRFPSAERSHCGRRRPWFPAARATRSKYRSFKASSSRLICVVWSVAWRSRLRSSLLRCRRDPKSN